MTRKKLVIVQNLIFHYRKPLYNELCEKYDVLIIHSAQSNVSKSDKFEELIVPQIKLGPFYFQKGLVRLLNQIEPEVVIALFDIRLITNVFFMMFKKKKIRFIWWGLDRGASQLAVKAKLLVAKAGFPVVFYHEKNKEIFLKLGLNRRNAYVANNTFDVGQRETCYDFSKDIILFVGTFDERKQVDVILRAFKNLLPRIPSNFKLVLIGEGKTKSKMIELSEDLKLGERAEYLPGINDPAILLNYYKRALCSVSFGQAGLSVLQSLGYGVPFITKANAITGGELHNIQDGINGFLCEDSQISLENKLLRLFEDPSFAKKMGENAYNYYSNNCTIKNMANGFVDVIETHNF